MRGLLDKVPAGTIVVDPEFMVGGYEEKREERKGGVVQEKEYSRLPRAEKLRANGKLDTTEDHSSDSDACSGSEGAGPKKQKHEEKVKKKMRGRHKSLKRYLRKQRKNVVDPQAVAVRAKLERQRDERERAKAAEKAGAKAGGGEGASAALDRFRRK